ncbi:MAG: cell division protein FtsZ [Thermoplasmata archaeon]
MESLNYTMFGEALSELSINAHSELKTTIKVMGIGGAGCNIVSRIADESIPNVELIAVNTDAKSLQNDHVGKKILIGKNLTRGMGATMPKIGEAAAKESEKQLRDTIVNTDLLFLICGLGGGTGSGSTPYIASLAKSLGIVTLVIATTPFNYEGKMRLENAKHAIERLKKCSDSLILVPNERLMGFARTLSINAAYSLISDILSMPIRSIAKVLTKKDIPNLREVVRDSGIALLGAGEAIGEYISVLTAEETIRGIWHAEDFPDISKVERAVIFLTCSPDISIEEAKHAIKAVHKKIHPRAKIMWSYVINNEYRKKMSMVMLLSGLGNYSMGNSSLEQSEYCIQNSSP